MKSSIEGRKQSWDGMFYSIQRIDLLVISICGAGIYVCLETVKYLASNSVLLLPTNLIKVSAGCFLLGIISNFVSQHYGYRANFESYLMYDCEVETDDINSLENIDDNHRERLSKLNCESEDFEKKSEKFSNLTTNLNYLSTGFMFIGLILTFLFFVISF